jgi:RNA polymerase sigma-70 factor (ECF subfamily)
MTQRPAQSERLQLVDTMPGDYARHGAAEVEPGPDDFETFDAFYRREYPRLVLLAQALVGRSQAADIAQDAMIVAYRRWDDVRGFVSPVGWVRNVCSNKAISVMRRKESERRALSRLRLRRTVDDVPGSGGEAEVFWQEVRLLPKRQAQVVALFYALDLTVADVAVTLDCAEGTVKVHLSRARHALAERLQPGPEDAS